MSTVTKTAEDELWAMADQDSKAAEELQDELVMHQTLIGLLCDRSQLVRL